MHVNVKTFYAYQVSEILAKPKEKIAFYDEDFVCTTKDLGTLKDGEWLNDMVCLFSVFASFFFCSFQNNLIFYMTGYQRLYEVGSKGSKEGESRGLLLRRMICKINQMFELY